MRQNEIYAAKARVKPLDASRYISAEEFCESVSSGWHPLDGDQCLTSELVQTSYVLNVSGSPPLHDRMMCTLCTA